jgi:thioredoxin-like negative regulator of GroEL
MRIHRLIFIAGMFGALAFSAPQAARSAELLSNPGALAEDPHESQLYSDATKAIDEGRWSDAEQLLDQVFNLHGRRADAALYWKAYVKNKEGRQSEALEACATLRQSFPQSNWLKECSALEIEIRGKSGNPIQPQAEQDEELKLLALTSIMEGGSSNSLPILQQILEGQSSEKLKERALFVLAENQSKQAQDLLGQIVRGEKDPKLQIKAIRLLGAAEGSKSASALESIYNKSSDPSVKKAVLDSYLEMNDPEKLVQIAQHESDPQLAHHAISELGAMGAVSRLSEIYNATSNKEVKSAIINAYVGAGSKGADALGAIASSEQDPDLRRKAIRNLGVSGGSAAVPALLVIYSKSSDEGSKKAALDGLFVADDAHDLVALARSEKDPVAKREIVGKLALMHSKEATDYMMELLNK